MKVNFSKTVQVFLFITLCFLLYFLTDHFTHKTERVYRSNGQIKEELRFKRDKRGSFTVLDGKARYYYSNGALKTERHYQNGMLNGRSVHYTQTGNILSSTQYKDDIDHGRKSFYYSNGSIKLYETYRNGIFHGEFKEFYPNGKVKRKGLNKNNILQYELLFDADGNLIYEKKYH